MRYHACILKALNRKWARLEVLRVERMSRSHADGQKSQTNALMVLNTGEALLWATVMGRARSQMLGMQDVVELGRRILEVGQRR